MPGLLDTMGPTPRKNKFMGLLADALAGANEYATQMDPRYASKRQNQTLGLLADAVSLGSIAKTADRLSYGESLTNAGKANVPLLKPETADVAMLGAVSPRNALAAMGMVGGVADNGAMRAATVWHGSPHKFDKFDASKIGAGEGAQAYGHGLYLAEAPEVAAAYRNAGLGSATDQRIATDEAKALFRKIYGSDKTNIGPLENYTADNLASKIDSGFRDFLKSKIQPDLFAAIEKSPYKGNLYKVDLPDDQIARMLDWDKPLSQQSAEVQAAAKNLGILDAANGEELLWKVKRTKYGVREAMQGNTGNSNAGLYASERLKSQGIPGIRYLDGGSRGAGAGSSNFVVFPGNEGLLSILERNGAPLGK